MANFINTITSAVPNAISNGIVRIAPTMTIKSQRATKFINWCDKNISSPENRLILGVTALMSQPFIDLGNKKVDEDTRKVSAARTVSKIVAGTLTGVLIRYGCIKMLNSFCKLPSEITPDMKFKKWRTLFTPSAAMKGELKDLTHYKNSFGTYFALFVMVFTNFLIDAPLTKFLTNKFIDRIHEKKHASNVLPEQAKIKEIANG